MNSRFLRKKKRQRDSHTYNRERGKEGKKERSERREGKKKEGREREKVGRDLSQISCEIQTHDR